MRMRIPALAAGALVLGAAAFYQGLVTRHYTLKTPKLPENSSLRFLLFSDLHGCMFGEDQRELLGAARRLAPDYILLAGDILDEHRPVRGARLLFQGASAIAPSFYAPGNHEYRTGRMPEVLRMVRRCGVTPLLDRFVLLKTNAGPLLIAGCEDPEKTLREDPDYRQEASLAAAFSGIFDIEAYKLLIAHKPERLSVYTPLGFDLIVSGHAHGGQLRIPGLLDNGLFASCQGFFPRYTGGLYHHDGVDQLVSRGLAVFRNLPTVFNPPEIVCLDLLGAQTETVSTCRKKSDL